jgi:hypothetical protein
VICPGPLDLDLMDAVSSLKWGGRRGMLSSDLDLRAEIGPGGVMLHGLALKNVHNRLSSSFVRAVREKKRVLARGSPAVALGRRRRSRGTTRTSPWPPPPIPGRRV